MGYSMGFDQPEWEGPSGVGGIRNICYKRKCAWRFRIEDVSATTVHSLPPARGSKPGLTLKEMQAEHLNETIYFPSKPDWKPITLTLYDIPKAHENPVFTWLKRAYNPKNCAYWKPSLASPTLKIGECYLEMYDGCGVVLKNGCLNMRGHNHWNS